MRLTLLDVFCGARSVRGAVDAVVRFDPTVREAADGVRADTVERPDRELLKLRGTAVRDGLSVRGIDRDELRERESELELPREELRTALLEDRGGLSVRGSDFDELPERDE